MSWLHKALQRAMDSQNDEEIDLLFEPENRAESIEYDPSLLTQTSKTVIETPPEISLSYPQTRRINVDEEQMKKNKIIFPDSTNGHLLEQYKVLRAQIFKRAEEKHWRTLMITSLGEGEGKTLTAINLSLIIAQEVRQTALLVDADLRKPSVLSYFGLDESPGLSDHLMEGIPLPQLLINPGIDSFTILPGGKPVQKSAEVLRSPQMTSMVEELKNRYDDRYILFDVPPLLIATDALVLSKQIDAVILVIEAGRTSKRDLKKGWKLLEWMNLLGVVLNKCTVDACTRKMKSY